MPKIERQIRTLDASGAPQILRDASGGETRVIEGYAIVFNQRSQLLPDWEKYRMVEETIPPTAVSSDMLTRCDVIANLEHDSSRMLARCKRGQGTLTLTVDTIGLKYRFEAPHTIDGDYALEMVRRGDLFGSSFAYSTDEAANVRYAKDGDTLVREVTRIDAIYDVAIVTNPAYLGTSVEARSGADDLKELLRSRAIPELEPEPGADTDTDTDTEKREAQLRKLRELARGKITPVNC